MTAIATARRGGGVGELLCEWRHRRCFSQLDLAVEAESYFPADPETAEALQGRR
jgi:hypothetical protein